MKRYLVITLLMITPFLISCGYVAPLENPEPELFSVFHEGDDFTILMRTEIDPDTLYVSMGYGIKSPKGYACITGAYEMVNYMVLYNDKYYDIVSGAEFNIYSAFELSDWGISVSCTIED